MFRIRCFQVVLSLLGGFPVDEVHGGLGRDKVVQVGGGVGGEGKSRVCGLN